MKLKPPTTLINAVAGSLHASLHYHLFGVEHIRSALRTSPTGSAIFLIWHQSLFTIVGPHRGLKVAALASRSGDGQIIADYMISMGLRPVRGSSARGAVAAAKELMQALEEGWNLAIACDGPKGPFKVPKSGPLELARRMRVPIVPIAARATREWTFKRSWDRFRLPQPRAHAAVCYGEPILYPAHDPSEAELAERVREVASRLHALEDEATRRCQCRQQ